MAIGMKLGAGVENPPMGASFLWGLPQMPEFLEYPFCKVPGYEAYPFFFVGQINCAEAAPFDESGLLPQKGFLWFFADLDYYLGYTEETVREPGPWDRKAVQVLYSHVGAEELAHEFLTFPAETEMMPPAARLIIFEKVPDDAPGPRMLGLPADPAAGAAFCTETADPAAGAAFRSAAGETFSTEAAAVTEETAGEKTSWLPLLQLPGDEDFDGPLFGFYIERAALKDRKFRRVEGFLSEGNRG